MHPVAVFGALVVVATTTAAGDGREEDGAKRLTPAEIQQVRASLERIRREVDRMEMEQESRDEELKRMAATWDFMTKKLPLPEVVARPETPTIKFAIPRGLAWLAAVQQVDGSWNTSLEANGLATLAYFPGPFDAEEPRIAQLRIRVFGGQVASASPTAPKDISWVLLSRCAVDAPPAELESLARRLVLQR